MATPYVDPQAGAIEATPLERSVGEARFSRVGSLILENRKATVGLAICIFFLLVAIVGPFIAPYDPTLIGAGPSLSGPSSAHWVGTTRLGQDIYSQLLIGTRNSLLVGLGVGILTTIVAVAIGMTAGYIGGIVDDVLMLFTNVFLILPSLPLAIVAASYARAFNVKGLPVIIIVLTLTGWAWAARVKRSQTLSLRSKDFVMAARVSGESWWRIIVFEVMPNMAALIAASFIFGVIFAVLGEAALEFIGLGDISAVTWGTMLYWAQNSESLLIGAWWWFIPPGVCIGLFAVGLTLLQYAIDEMTNPRLKVQRTPKQRAEPATAMQTTMDESVLESDRGSATA